MNPATLTADQQLHAHCVRWQQGLRTRRLLAPPQQRPNILARMQPHQVRPQPDGPMSADMALFDLAVRSLPDGVDKAALIAFYGPRRLPVKTLADRLGVSRRTFYKAVKRAQQAAWELSLRLAQAQQVVIPLDEQD
jgi:transcriptional regulator of acetoin/glycerol metabolism